MFNSDLLVRIGSGGQKEFKYAFFFS